METQQASQKKWYKNRKFYYKVVTILFGIVVTIFVILVIIGSAMDDAEKNKEATAQETEQPKQLTAQKIEMQAVNKTEVPVEKPQEEKTEEEQKAKELAEQKSWEKTKAGQICLKHPEWTKTDCEKIADKKYWIGMGLTMLIELRGKPNSFNPSDYGSGVRYQLCWTYKTPSCFYSGEDGIIDSYN